MEVFNAIENYAVEVADQPVLIDDEATIPWKELPDQVDRICLGLAHAGMRRRKGVAVLIGRRRHLSLALLAVMRGGGVAVPLAPSFGREVVLAMADASRPQLLVYDAELAELAAEIRSRHELRGIVRIGAGAGPDEIPWSQLEETDIEGARFPLLDADTVVLHNYGLDVEGGVYAALGTLGRVWTAAAFADRGLKLRQGDCFLDLFPAGVLAHEMILRTVHMSGTLVVCRETQPAAAYAAAVRHRANVLVAPACTYHNLCDWLAESGGSLADMRVLEARGRVPQNLARRARDGVGRELLPTRAWAETLAPALGAVPTGFGAPAAPLQPYPGFREKIVSGSGRELPEKEVGELCLASDVLAEKTMDSENEQRLVCDPDGWFHTGTLARRQSSGELVLLGSRFDVLLRDRVRVYLREVADVLETAEGVREAEAIVLDQGGGELVLFVAAVLEPIDGREITSSQLMEYLWERLEASQVPEDVLVLDALPRLPDGRVDRGRLRAVVQEKTGDLTED